MKKFFKIFLGVAVFLVIALIIAKPEVYVESAFFGIKLWAIKVLPALLPFFFLTAVAIKLGVTDFIAKIFEKPCNFLFKVSGVGAFVFVMSLLSGYPIGAKMIADLSRQGVLSKEESTKISTFCSTSGPLFIVGSVGIGMFNDKTAGFIILISHLLSAVLCGIIFSFYGKKESEKRLIRQSEKSRNALYDCVYSSVISVALVGGFVCIFCLFSDLCKNLNLLLPLENLLSPLVGQNLSSAFCYGLIECTKGCNLLANCGLSTYSLAFATALISFGGVSVWAQSIIFLSQARVNLKVFCLSKTLQAIASFFICLGLCTFIGV